MATWEDVRRLALALPETAEGTSYGDRAWKVRGRLFAWERPLRPADRAALGDAAPRGPVLAVYVEHLVAKEALLADAASACFATPHFDGHPIVLARLDAAGPGELEELVTEAWLARAPAAAARRFLDARRAAPDGAPGARAGGGAVDLTRGSPRE